MSLITVAAYFIRRNVAYANFLVGDLGDKAIPFIEKTAAVLLKAFSNYYLINTLTAIIGIPKLLLMASMGPQTHVALVIFVSTFFYVVNIIVNTIVCIYLFSRSVSLGRWAAAGIVRFVHDDKNESWPPAPTGGEGMSSYIETSVHGPRRLLEYHEVHS